MAHMDDGSVDRTDAIYMQGDDGAAITRLVRGGVWALLLTNDADRRLP